MEKLPQVLRGDFFDSHCRSIVVQPSASQWFRSLYQSWLAQNLSFIENDGQYRPSTIGTCCSCCQPSTTFCGDHERPSPSSKTGKQTHPDWLILTHIYFLLNVRLCTRRPQENALIICPILLVYYPRSDGGIVSSNVRVCVFVCLSTR